MDCKGRVWYKCITYYKLLEELIGRICGKGIGDKSGGAKGNLTMGWDYAVFV